MAKSKGCILIGGVFLAIFGLSGTLAYNHIQGQAEEALNKIQESGDNNTPSITPAEDDVIIDDGVIGGQTGSDDKVEENNQPPVDEVENVIPSTLEVTNQCIEEIIHEYNAEKEVETVLDIDCEEYTLNVLLKDNEFCKVTFSGSIADYNFGLLSDFYTTYEETYTDDKLDELKTIYTSLKDDTSYRVDTSSLITTVDNSLLYDVCFSGNNSYGKFTAKIATVNDSNLQDVNLVGVEFSAPRKNAKDINYLAQQLSAYLAGEETIFEEAKDLGFSTISSNEGTLIRYDSGMER